MNHPKRQRTDNNELDAYLHLVREFPLRPIRTEAEHDEAIGIVNGLAVHEEGTLGKGRQDYLEALTRFIEDYEDRQHRIDTSDLDPLDLLRHLMDEHHMTVSDLGRLIGSKGVASEVLNGKRRLSKAQIGKLAAHFGVNPGVFLGVTPSKVTRPPKRKSA
jgi:HTH-type transcriptional regulator/antitoxin HigA